MIQGIRAARRSPAHRSGGRGAKPRDDSVDRLATAETRRDPLTVDDHEESSRGKAQPVAVFCDVRLVPAQAVLDPDVTLDVGETALFPLSLRGDVCCGEGPATAGRRNAPCVA